MKRFQMISILTFISVILFTECGNDVDPETQEMNFIGNEVMIGYNETVLLHDSVEGKDFELLFTGKIKDNRCPESSCEICYPNLAFIDLYWKEENLDDSAKLTVHITGCVPQCGKLDTLGYSFCLISLGPYPWEIDSSLPNDYAANIKIERL